MPIGQCFTLNRDEKSDSLRLGIYGSGNDGLHADSKSLPMSFRRARETGVKSVSIPARTCGIPNSISSST